MRIVSRIQEGENYSNTMIGYMFERRYGLFVLTILRLLLSIHIEKGLTHYKRTRFNRQIRISACTKLWYIGFTISIKI